MQRVRRKRAETNLSARWWGDGDDRSLNADQIEIAWKKMPLANVYSARFDGMFGNRFLVLC